MGDSLDSRQREQYSRQLMIDSIGESDQQQLLSSRVLVVGAGGLGSAAIQYLAAAGVGTIAIVDDGHVTRSNLQRQIVHTLDDIGEPKVDSAARFVEARNSDVTVERHATRMTVDVAESLFEEADVVVDAVDGFPTRFILNDIARLAGIPFVHGAVYAFEGQLTVFRPGGPCYRCLLPAVPDADVAPSGEPMGIFPTVPGTIGCLQATEALKHLLEVGEPLDDRLLRYDATDETVLRTPLERDPDCPVCGPDGIDSIDDLEYDDRYRIER
ncbi:ThiF family adenylyltransferase [Natronolimnohabitans sp. A-GB9]|uniref:HesA/MoeB/ThiF family protein n=1 Tax=Natronolimnohabitans sp. A-GB9 TaxID=3069757 RepID=UPI0027B7230A|nr:ThiF family adenylyltransferase [Natronolimnohabitans sp. A-GB9]MDQ2052573.1 ThiF family adenylyltransferase [Natronolimnohabitans sp. A-GB9]